MYWLSVVFLIYMFVALYFFFFFMLLYLKNKESIYAYPKLTKKYKISIIIPCYNEEDCIEGTIKAVLESDYPIEKVFIVNDGSKDRTAEVVEKLAKRNKKIVLLNKQNGGKADSLNYALKFVKTELVAIVDSDSYPDKDAISKVVGFFDNPRVGVATCAVLARNKNLFIEKLQAIEYTVIAWTRKLLGYIGAIYVTPGPLAIYRTDVIRKLGFDTKNMTEDIEATWHLAAEGWGREMCLSARATTITPSTFKGWYNQRVRWNMGGIQTINKYKWVFAKRGMIGCFILPYFVLSLTLGLVGLSIFFYLFFRRVIFSYISTKLRLDIGVPVLTIDQLYITPTVLNFLGLAMFILGTIFTILGLSVMKEKELRDRNIFNLLFYLLLYLTVYPFIMPVSIYRLAKKDLRW